MLRVLATLWLLQLLLQIYLAAGFITGNVGWFNYHSLNGFMINFLPIVMLIVAVLHATVARGRWWPVLWSLLAILVGSVQMVLGAARSVAAHIVGGSVLLGLAVLGCVLFWRHHYQPRPAKKSAPVAAQVGS